MRPFDRYFSLLEKVVEPRPGTQEWIPEPDDKTQKNLYTSPRPDSPYFKINPPAGSILNPEKDYLTWQGYPPEKWTDQGRGAVVDGVFNLKNAGPFKFTTNFLNIYSKLRRQKPRLAEIIRREFRDLVNSPDKTTTVESKQSNFLGGRVYLWRFRPDMYLLFDIKGPLREVVWFELMDDHQVYTHYLKTGEKV
jgi:hypothetical protein